MLKEVASFVGQIISMVNVIGDVALIMPKIRSVGIAKVDTWRSCITLSEESEEQLNFVETI